MLLRIMDLKLKLKRLNDGFVSHKHTAFQFTRHELMISRVMWIICGLF